MSVAKLEEPYIASPCTDIIPSIKPFNKKQNLNRKLTTYKPAKTSDTYLNIQVTITKSS